MTEEDLQQLAEDRAAAVRDALLGAKPAVTQRIFTTRASSPQGEGTDARKACRVDFRLTD